LSPAVIHVIDSEGGTCRRTFCSIFYIYGFASNQHGYVYVYVVYIHTSYVGVVSPRNVGQRHRAQ
jgi:hypothetical protein